jgi:hypothetical protein
MLAEPTAAAGRGQPSPQTASTPRSLTAAVADVVDLPRADRWRMYAIYQAHYDATSWARFEADLDDKMCAVIVRNDAGAIQGFTTLSILETSLHGARIRAIYSGDTIIDREYWGSQQLAFTWIRLAGSIKALEPQTPLYWFLIVKGHRTYRYLSAFSETFYPHWAYETPPATRALMDHLGGMRFAEFYRPALGVIQFPESRGHLKAQLAAISPAETQRADVAFFLARNPGYAVGDELLCLTELCADNLRPHARRHFLEGFRK